jgi:hypothetical protein
MSLPDAVVSGGEGSSGSSGGDGGGSSTPAASTSSAGGEAQTSSSGSGSVAKEAPAAEALAYTPNYKLKVMDQDKEIPESFRSLMKDAKSEEEVRKVFEKAYGLEFAKPKHEATQQSFTQLQSQHNQVLGSIQELKEFYNKGDLDSFFERLAIPPQRILQYALEKVNYSELPPEQRAMIDARRTAELQARNVQRENVGLQRQHQELQVQTRTMQLNSALADVDTKTLADTFDQRVGQPGAFRREVINRGRLAAFESQGRVDLSPEQAIEQVVKMYGLKNAAQQGGPSATPQTSGGQPRAATIPNVGAGKSSAPIKQKPKSIDDLKKLYAAM